MCVHGLMVVGLECISLQTHAAVKAVLVPILGIMMNMLCVYITESGPHHGL